MILAGDVGGTKTILACFERASDGLRLRAEASFASGEHASFQEILDRFLADHDARPEAACFGIAGPVVEGRATTTNLPWPALEEAELRRWLGVERVLLANDLEAAAYGMLALPAADLVALDPEAGPGRPGNAAVIAAGTGLGEAFLVWDGRRYRAVAGEGGHVDFAPRSDEQIELLRFARQELGGRVSVERLLSGPGLHRIYRFARGGEGAEPSWLARRLESEEPAFGPWGFSSRSTVPRPGTWPSRPSPWAACSWRAGSLRASFPHSDPAPSWRPSGTRAASGTCWARFRSVWRRTPGRPCWARPTGRPGSSEVEVDAGAPPEPVPLRGWRRFAALLWIGAVALLYLAVRELGVRVVP
jgi:glucokinase